MKKISILVADNPYGSTVQFSQAVKAAAQNIGVDATIHNVREGHLRDILDQWDKQPPEATLSFSDIQMGQGNSFAEVSPFPHYSLLVDPAIYFLHHLLSNKGKVTCVDRSDLSMMQTMKGPVPLFLPHAGDGRLKNENKKRVYPYVFFGSCIDYREIEKLWPERFGKQHALLLREVSRRALFSPSSIAEALIEAATPQELFIPFHFEVDLYVRGRERIELLTQFPQAHIWGKGPWTRFFPNRQVHPSLSFAKTIEVMQQAQIVLNASSRFKEASHERILYALLCGAVPLSATNPYLIEIFESPKEILLFPKGGWKQARALADQHISNLTLIAQEGGRKVRERHLWEHRLRELFLIE